jgi:Zn ribbon nucleic-acid-binding protein
MDETMKCPQCGGDMLLYSSEDMAPHYACLKCEFDLYGNSEKKTTGSPAC